MLCHEQIDTRHVERSEFFQDFLIPEGLRWAAGTTALRTERHDYTLGLSRGKERGCFQPHEQALLQRLMPHVQRSLALMERMGRKQSLAHGAAAALDAGPWAVLMLDAGGHIRHANRQAQAMLQRGQPIRARQHVLSGADAVHTKLISTALERCVATGQPQSVRLRTSGSITLAVEAQAHGVTFSRVPPAADSPWPKPPLFHCIVSPLEHRRIATVEQLMQVFGLTPAEARLTRAVVHKETLAAYAEQSGVKITTVKTQLRAVLDKTGTHGQAELMRVVLAVPALRSPGTPRS